MEQRENEQENENIGYDNDRCDGGIDLRGGTADDSRRTDSAVPGDFRGLPGRICAGTKKGTIAVGLYLLIGIIGVPVFSGFSGGFQKLAGVTGGYLVGYLPCAYMSGEGAEKRERIGWWYHPLMMIAGTALLYLVGTVNFMLHTGNGLGAALALCVVPFLIGDAVKIAAAALLTVPVRKAVKLIKN